MHSRLLLILALLAVVPNFGARAADPPLLRVGHVGHDHHTALYVALDHSGRLGEPRLPSVEVVEDRKRYRLLRDGATVADLEIVKVGGGSKMPTAIAQGAIDVGLGGVAAVLAAVDRGAGLRLIAPLHYKGDMLVVAPGLPPRDWAGFVRYVREADEPVRVGYKSPMAVAKLVLEEALRHEGLSFSSSVADREAQVHLINVKGGGKLNPALAHGLVQAYVGNNPFPALAADKGLGRIVCDLEELPPGRFRDHPCCCIAASTQAIEERGRAIETLLMLIVHATDTMNADADVAVQAASRWIGTSPEVERMSIATSGYETEPDGDWHARMAVWVEAMNGLDVFGGRLEGLTEKELRPIAYDFSLLESARQELERSLAP